MPKTRPSPSKKKQKVVKKRKKSHSNHPKEALSNVCNVTGLDVGVAGLDVASGGGSTVDRGGGMGDNLMDCLDELASAQVGMAPSNSSEIKTNDASVGTEDSDADSPPSIRTPDSPPPPPPGLHRIPNLRIELARHLQTQTLSAFLLQSCPGLRMPTFERWLLDSKLEESDRFQSIVEEWMDDPSRRLARANGKSKKKKYGRAAMYQQKQDDEQMAQHERENARKEKDCKLLFDAEKRIPRAIQNHDRCGYVGRWIRHVQRDPILPYHVMECDPSCDRLLKEVVAAMSANDDSGKDLDQHQLLQKGRETVRDLCHRTAEACNELCHLEHRFGKFQKFGWDSTSTAADGGGKKKRKRGSSGSGGGNVDKIQIEWQSEDASSGSTCTHRVCSLIYVAKKRKTSRPAGLVGVGGHAAVAEAVDSTAPSHKPKPFVIKLNAFHYHKLRAMFEATYLSDASVPVVTKEQSTHALHALLFAMVLRYSSLSGGQQLGDLRGGGMQGAVHEGVFDCLSKWFGGSAASGVECFASPFNCTLSRFFSAFPSPDIDGHFGSHGDFFHPPSESDFLNPRWFQFNPPFSPGVMNKMANRIDKLLEMQRKGKRDVTFIVVIPTVRSFAAKNGPLADKTKAKKKKKKRHKHSTADPQQQKSNNTNLMSAVHHAASQSFHQLINSPYCRSHIVLPAQEHGYIEGGQHLRPTKYKESQYSTSVIVLGNKNCLSTDDAKLFEEELREAFASQHKEEIKGRKVTSK